MLLIFRMNFRLNWQRIGIVLGFFLAFTIPGDAAEFIATAPINGVYPILIKGEIVRGDAYDFSRLTRNKGRVLVGLSSPGGEVGEALRIGAEIRTKDFATTVADECDSACALIWLSGARRYLNSNAKLGFHAAYVMRNGVPVETGMGNAEVGGFLASLGLSREAIQFVTAAPPEGVRWLTLDDAQRLGISIRNSAQVGPPGDPPSYVTKPVPENTAKEQAAKTSFLASHLASVLACTDIYHVNTEYVKTLHRELMDQGIPLGGLFKELLAEELVERSREMRRDGLTRFCIEQKELFTRAGLTKIYVN
jgi:hypothetical protein